KRRKKSRVEYANLENGRAEDGAAKSNPVQRYWHVERRQCGQSGQGSLRDFLEDARRRKVHSAVDKAVGNRPDIGNCVLREKSCEHGLERDGSPAARHIGIGAGDTSGCSRSSGGS